MNNSVIRGRPPKDPGAKHRAVSLTLPADLERALRQLATWHGRPLSQLVARLLRESPDRRWRSLLDDSAGEDDETY